MPLYEHVFLARQDVSQAQVDALIKEFTEVIEQGGGKVVRHEYWGVKSIAYKIKKNRKAHYTMLHLDAPHPAVAEMERRMGLSTDIIRYLTTRVEAHEAEPSVMMRKSDRDDRRGPGDRDGGPRGPRPFRGDRPPRDRDGDGPRGDRPPRDRDGDGFRGPRGDRGDRPPRPPRDAAPRSET
ncbi:MAG TPA: 30S ribosomal protein S6 [Hyphomicrobiaceae bacterium]|nr:30S ribosomal protein S6 [Hyphomicrobiaceae bacterium]